MVYTVCKFKKNKLIFPSVNELTFVKGTVHPPKFSSVIYHHGVPNTYDSLSFFFYGTQENDCHTFFCYKRKMQIK